MGYRKPFNVFRNCNNELLRTLQSLDERDTELESHKIIHRTLIEKKDGTSDYESCQVKLLQLMFQGEFIKY